MYEAQAKHTNRERGLVRSRERAFSLTWNDGGASFFHTRLPKKSAHTHRNDCGNTSVLHAQDVQNTCRAVVTQEVTGLKPLRGFGAPPKPRTRPPLRCHPKPAFPKQVCPQASSLPVVSVRREGGGLPVVYHAKYGAIGREVTTAGQCLGAAGVPRRCTFHAMNFDGVNSTCACHKRRSEQDD